MSLGFDKLLPQLRLGKLLRMWGPAHGHAVPGTFCSFPHQNALQELHSGLVDPRQTSAPSPEGPGALLSAPTWLLSPIFMHHTHWEPLLAGPVLRAALGAPGMAKLTGGRPAQQWSGGLSLGHQLPCLPLSHPEESSCRAV